MQYSNGDVFCKASRFQKSFSLHIRLIKLQNRSFPFKNEHEGEEKSGDSCKKCLKLRQSHVLPRTASIMRSAPSQDFD